jgi:hypothetical protein
MRGWIAVHAPDTEGVPNDVRTEYRYDDGMPNHRQVAAGDLLFLRNQEQLLAIARIHEIDTTTVEKTSKRCPVCQVGQIVLRVTRSAGYRCLHGHEFQTPLEETRVVTQYIARFRGDVTRLGATIEPAELRPFELTNRRHLGLRGCDLHGLARYLARRDHKTADVLKAWMMERDLTLGDEDADSALTTGLFLLDDRERPFHSIRLRRGLATFRDKLIGRYGAQCAVSGCTVLALLEAAHIQPFQGRTSFMPANGLLLRSDIHTLFDLDLIGFEPASLTVVLSPRLGRSEYAQFGGLKLHIPAGKEPNARALKARWERFCSLGQSAVSAPSRATQTGSFAPLG